MPTTSAHGRAVERIIRLCRGHDDALALRVALLNEIRRTVGFEAHAWLLTDPVTTVGVSPLAETPDLADLPRLIRLKYLTAVNRWTQLVAPVATLRAATGDKRERSLVWREVLAGYGVDDVASVVFGDRFGCWGFLDLWRMASGDRFTPAEAGFLAEIVGPVTTALRVCQALCFVPPAEPQDRAGPVVLVLSPALEVRAQTPETEAYLRALVPTTADRPPVPAGAYNVAAQLLAVESGVDDHPAWARVHLAAGEWLTLRAARMGDTVPVDRRDIAVSVETCSPAERLDLFVRCHGLSAREAELLGHLAAGADTHHISQQMFLSEHTVQDHLKSIFTKTSTRTRRTLLTHALGR